MISKRTLSLAIFFLFLVLPFKGVIAEPSEVNLFANSFECKNSKDGSKEANSKEYLLSFLRKVQDSYEGVSSMQASFSQDSYMAALDMSEVSSGKVEFKSPGKMKWNYSKPEPQVFLVDHPNVWLHQPNEKMTIVDKFDTFVLSDVPVAFLLGLGRLEKSFALAEKCVSNDGILLKLKPKISKEAGELDEFLLLVSNKTFRPIGASVYDIGGNRTTIFFKNIVFNKEISKGAFNPPSTQGIDVVDRRKL